MNIAGLIKKGETFITQNSTTILTSVGVTGTVTTAYLSGRASFKAAIVIEDDRYRRVELEGVAREYGLKEKAQMVWPLYIPAVGVGSLTIASIIMANRIGSKKAAALAAAYGISEKAFQEYKEKVVQKLGENKERTVRDEIAQDRVNANPAITKEVIITGAGDVLCFDMLTGRYFQSTVENIKSAQNKVNEEIISMMYASLGSFYDEIGLPSTQLSDTLGFNTNNYLEVVFSTVLSADQRPCVAIDFANPPVADYGKLY